MLCVVLGQRPDAVICQEFGLVQHPLQDLLQSLSVHESQKQSVILATVPHTGNVAFGHIILILNEPVKSALEGRELVDDFRF